MTLSQGSQGSQGSGVTTRSATRKAAEEEQQPIQAPTPRAEMQWMNIMVQEWIARTRKAKQVPLSPTIRFIHRYETEYQYHSHDTDEAERIRQYVKRNSDIGVDFWNGNFYFPTTEFGHLLTQETIKEMELTRDHEQVDSQASTPPRKNHNENVQQQQSAKEPVKQDSASKQSMTVDATTTAKDQYNWKPVANRKKPKQTKKKRGKDNVPVPITPAKRPATTSTYKEALLPKFDLEIQRTDSDITQGSSPDTTKQQKPAPLTPRHIPPATAKRTLKFPQTVQEEEEEDDEEIEDPDSTAYDTDKSNETTDSWGSVQKRFKEKYHQMEEQATKRTVEMVVDSDKFLTLCETAQANMTKETMSAVKQQLKGYMEEEMQKFQDATFIKEQRERMTETWKDMKEEINQRLWILQNDKVREKQELELQHTQTQQKLADAQKQIAQMHEDAKTGFKDHVATTYVRQRESMSAELVMEFEELKGALRREAATQAQHLRDEMTAHQNYIENGTTQMRSQVSNWVENHRATLIEEFKSTLTRNYTEHLESSERTKEQMQSDLDSLSAHATDIMRQHMSTLRDEIRREVTQEIHNLTQAAQRTQAYSENETPRTRMTQPPADQHIQPEDRQVHERQGRQQSDTGTSSRWNVSPEVRDHLNGMGRGPPTPSYPHPQNGFGNRNYGNKEDKDADYYHRKFKQDTPSTILTGATEADTKREYCAFQYFAGQYKVPLLEWEAITADITSLYPPTSEPADYRKFSQMMYQKLEEPGVIDDNSQILRGLMLQYNTDRDGYKVLREMTRHYAVTSNGADSARYNTIPTFNDDIFEYAGKITQHFEYQQQQGRTYSTVEQTSLYLDRIRTSTTFKEVIEDIRLKIQTRAPHETINPDYHLEKLPMTILREHRRKNPGQTIRMNAARSYQDRGNSNRGSSYQDRGNSYRDRGTYQDRGGRGGRGDRGDRENRRPQYGGRGDDRRASFRKPEKKKDVQCRCCGLNGHEEETCNFFPKLYAGVQFMEKHDKKAQQLYQSHLNRNAPGMRTTMMRELRAYVKTEDDAEELCDNIMDMKATMMYETPPDPEYDDDDNDRYEQEELEEPREHRMNRLAAYKPDHDEIRDLKEALQPLKYPTKETVNRDEMLTMVNTTQEEVAQEITIANVRIKEDCDADDMLTDTGANCSGTNQRGLMHDYQPGSKYKIRSCHGHSEYATGEGYLHLVNKAGEIEKVFALYSPHLDGTIISPEHHACTNPEIYTWIQESIPSEGRGTLRYVNKAGIILSEYDTIRKDGLYYMANAIFRPNHTIYRAQMNQLQCHEDSQKGDNDQWLQHDTYNLDHDLSHWEQAFTDGTYHMKVHTVDEDGQLEDALDEHLEDILDLAAPTSTDTPDLADTTKSDEVKHGTGADPPPTTRRKEPTPTQRFKNLLQLELWHQRLAHIGKDKLHETQKCVEGIPELHVERTVAPLVKCAACDIAKMKKAPKGPNATHEGLKPGQQFQMDLGFFRGPSNLQEVLQRTEKPKPKIIESRQGFTSYLLAICAFTRFVWVFLLKSKDPPLTLVNKFLAAYGRHDTTHRIIRTDGDGALALSAEFRKMVFHKHGYLVEVTGSDSSSQNAMSERPHQTFGNMVRCILYNALMGTEFWADALVYAVYVYNRVYHSVIKMTPYQKYTGEIPNLSHLRTFGAHVTAKRPGPRSTKLDPNYYEGRVLRPAPTSKNVIYWDTHTKKEKTARHYTIDEIHYSQDDRPPGAQHLMDLINPTDGPLGGKAIKEPPSHLQLVKETPIPPEFGGPLAPLKVETVAESNEDQQRLPDYGGAMPLPTQPGGVTPIELMPTVAAAAKMKTTKETCKHEIEHLHTSNNMYATPITHKVRTMGTHPTLGFEWKTDRDTGCVFLKTIKARTPAYKIKRWKSQLRFAVLRSINGQPVKSEQWIKEYIAKARSDKVTQLEFEFAKIEAKLTNDEEVPQLHMDQLRHINKLQSQAKQRQSPAWSTKKKTKNFSRRQIAKKSDAAEWYGSERKQLDKYAQQNMFGAPIPRPTDSLAIILPFVWTYLYKEDATAAEKGIMLPKARATCNGGKRYGKAVTLAETYANCVEQPASRLYWALVAALGLIAYGADAGNAFAEAPPPEVPFYMEIDQQYRDWWAHNGNGEIPEGYVLPVLHALQGHPEAPRLWEHHIDGILKANGFTATTHERCLYYKCLTPDDIILFLRQVDDFAVAATDTNMCKQTIDHIGEQLIVPLNDLGLIKKFNGVDILQTRDYVKVSCESYLKQVIENHGWQNLVASNKPVPMRTDGKAMAILETAERPETEKERLEVESQAGFGYRSVMGEIVYAMVTARPDLSFATTKLSRYNQNPAKCHYQALKQVMAYLNATQDQGLIYWRSKPRHDLPYIPPPEPLSNPTDTIDPLPTQPTEPAAYSDSDWGSDRETRRSVTGIVIMLAGAAILWKTAYQATIALSSTEAEFVAGSETGKCTLYIRHILHELGFTFENPTKIYQDNHGAIHMANAQAPTRRTRHVEIRHFALLQWVESNQVILSPIGTDANHSDAMTKALGRTKFHQHADVYMGRLPPTYVTNTAPSIAKVHFLSATNNAVLLAACDPEV